MKTHLSILCLGLSVSVCPAAPETWTSKDGRSVEMELTKVTTEGEVKIAEFRTKAGRIVKLKSTDLAEESALRLSLWTPPPAEPAAPAPAAVADTASVFDGILGGNLVKLQGKSLKRTELEKPTKYYLFYYTASWCGPCHKFTPSLVEFYNAHKPQSKDFELVLITSDSDEKSMESYAEEMHMPWPQLKLFKVEKFKKEFKYPGNGIPNLVLTDLKGNVLKASYEGTEYKGPGVVMDHLAGLLK